MKEIKVHLQYPWKSLDSAYHRYLVNYPPDGIKYVNVEGEKIALSGSTKKFMSSRYLKNRVRGVLKITRIPNITYSSTRADLIHCAHCLSLSKKPWVVDTETYNTLSASSAITYSRFCKRLIRKLLLKKECKKILPWTEAAKRSIVNALKDKEIKNKIEVVYPAVPLPRLRKRETDKINLLFIGRNFYEKGGLTVLTVFDALTKKYDNVEANLISSVPNIYFKKYSKNDKMKIMTLVPQRKLFEEFYPKADIFVYPGYSDTFGFAMLEAISFSLPVITVDGFARKEIIKNGKTGFVIDRPKNLNYCYPKSKKMIEGLIEKTSILIENLNLRKRMDIAARKEIGSGKFSMDVRNKKLRKIYEEVLE